MLPKLKEKYDYKKALKALFNPPSKLPVFITVPAIAISLHRRAGEPK